MKPGPSLSNVRSAPAGRRKRGNVLVLAAAIIVGVFGFAAFSIDVGYIALAKTQLQTAADAAALSAAAELPPAWGLGPEITSDAAVSLGQSAAQTVAAANRAADRPSVYLDKTRDVSFGRRTWDANTNSWSESWGVPPYNLVKVDVLRSVTGLGGVSSSNGDGPLNLFFGKVIGHDRASLSTSATAALVPISGFRITPGSGDTVGILPIAYDLPSWTQVAAGVGNDVFKYDPKTGAITPGSGGIVEFDLYPYGPQGLTPGNRGTVDIGSSGNSTADLKRQILYGLNEFDLSFYGGEFRWDLTPMQLNGDTGISAGIKTQLEAIKGQPRVIPIFSQVSGPGNNAMYTIVKFVGIRILEVKLTGGTKYVKVQSAPFVTVNGIRSTSSVVTTESLLGPAALVR